MRLTLDNGRPRDIDTLMALVDARYRESEWDWSAVVNCPCGVVVLPKLDERFVWCAACGRVSDAGDWRIRK